MAGVMSQIEHIVVLMLENRSFDNLLGWLYGPGDPPAHVIGGKPGDPPFFGLAEGSYWNPSNATFFGGAPPEQVFATRGTTGGSPFTVPDPDPLEGFDDITFQIFGTTTPTPGQPATMLGFLVDYEKAGGTNPASLMETYAPEQVTVLAGLARNFAVCDAWYASAPCQTWPNRAFTHLGTSLGRVNNAPDDPFDFNVPTIFNVLRGAGHSWAVYSPGLTPSLTRLQFPKLWSPALDGHFRGIAAFLEQARDGTLPSYSFVEPSFLDVLSDPADEHPPHDVCLGEHFILSIYSALADGPNWGRTLLVITFDEHGGCPDHRPTPWGALTPDLPSFPGQEGFNFDRFGVRVPTVLVSPWIAAGTVLRSATAVPYDHTSILATLRDWLAIPAAAMLPSARVAAAPTLASVLNAPAARADRPTIAAACTSTPRPARALTPPNSLQRSMVAASVRKLAGQPVDQALVAKVLAATKTREQAARFLAD